MKKTFLSVLGLVFVVFIGSFTFGLTSSANKVNLPPEKPAEMKILYKKNKDKTLISADEFIKKIDNDHNKKDSEPVLREKVLYKDVNKITGEKDVMHWVNPDRQIYVVKSKFKSYETLDGILTNVTITTYYDAETGDELGFDLKGTPPENYKTPIERHASESKN